VRGKFVWASILAIAIVLATMVGTTSATQTKISVTPGNLGRLNPGDVFEVDITVDGVVGLSSWDFKLAWDAFVIRPTGTVTKGPFLGQDGTYSTFFLYNIALTFDRMIVGEIMMGPWTTDGSGVLATIEFEVVGAGSTDIDLYETKLLDYYVVNMPHNVFDGHLTSHMVAEIEQVWGEASIIPIEDQEVCLSAELENKGSIGTVTAWVEFIGFDMGGTMIRLASDKVDLDEGESAIVQNCEFNATYYGVGVYKFYTRCFYEYAGSEFYAMKEKHLRFEVR
jgi:hypothetical protein